MALSDETHRIKLEEIWIDRAARQRTKIDISDLVESVRERKGLIHPIIVERDVEVPEGYRYKLLTGERRTETCRFLAHETILARFADEIDPIEREMIELEENVKRSELPWQDYARSIAKIHRLHQSVKPDWDVEATAAMCKISTQYTYKNLEIAEAIEAGDQTIASADTFSNARTIFERRKGRQVDEAMNRITETEFTLAPPISVEQIVGEALKDTPEATTGFVQVASASRVALDSPFRIICANAMDFFENPLEKFNFLQCDFPYGVELHEQAGQASFEGGGYASDAKIYEQLCKAMAVNWNKFMYPSSHVMFWISMEFYEWTMNFFEQALPQVKMQKTPLVWHKTDNKGILADPKRGPRRTYEACLFGASGDRFVVKPVANSYGAPTDKSSAIHTNEKPEPMLRHFMSMFVDGHTKMLDPTCGSGSSVRVAESLGAESALGLEFNPEFASRAQEKLLSARKLRIASEALNGN